MNSKTNFPGKTTKELARIYCEQQGIVERLQAQIQVASKKASAAEVEIHDRMMARNDPAVNLAYSAPDNQTIFITKRGDNVQIMLADLDMSDPD